MARLKTSGLSNKAKRLALPIDKNPVWEVLGAGVSLGYRRCEGAGTWVARRTLAGGKKKEKRIGVADDFDDADGVTVFSFAQAHAAVCHYDPVQTAAEAKARAEAKIPTTVAQALDKYEKDLEARGGDAGNAQRLRAHLGKDIQAKAVSALTTNDLRTWRDGLLAKELTPSTVNRISNAFKAALNLTADHDDAILTRSPWEKGLASLHDAEEARNVILTDEEVRKIIEAAYQQGDEFGLLVELSAVTGARYSQIAGLTVGDLQADRDEPRLMMPSSKKGRGVKKVLRRPVPISVSLARKLVQAAGDRRDEAPLLLKPRRPQTKKEKKTGLPPPPPGPWSKSDHYRLFKRAVVAAFKIETASEAKEVQPTAATGETKDDPITIYALRHSSIVRQILAGVPVRIVAVMHDTSVQMIERTYSKHLADHTDAIARAAMLSFVQEA